MSERPVTAMLPGGSFQRAIRSHRFALAFLAAATLTLFVAPLLKQEVFTLRDHFDYFQPLHWFTAEELKAGRLPLWNPYSASGEPWLANPQTGVFYPPAWLFVVLPFATAYMLYLCSHLVLLGWGGYLLFGRTGSRGAALVGAVALTFSGPVLSLLDVSNNLTTLAWLPLALWCAAEGAWRRGGVVLALAFLGGEPFFAAIIAVLFAVTGVAAARGAGLPVSQRLRVLVLSGVVAIGVSAVQLFPFLDMLKGSDRAHGMGSAQVLRESMPVRDWHRVALPSPSREGRIDPSPGQEYIPVVYMGTSVVLLALIGCARIRRRRDLQGWLLLLLCSVLLSAGPAVLAALPASPVRYPARFLALAVFSMAALAAAGWDLIRRDRRWLDLLVVLVILGDLVPRMRPLLGTAPFDPEVVRYDTSIGRETKILRLGEIDPARREEWIAGYLNLYDRRFDAHTAAPVASKAYLDLQRRLIETPTAELVSSAGIGFLVTDRPVGDSLPTVASRNGVVIHGIPNASPVVTFTAKRNRTVMPVTWAAGTSSIRLTVDALERGLVTVRQQSSSSWNVAVNGETAIPVRVDGHFLGVELEEGRHEVVWRYRPLSLVAGGGLSIVTLLALQFSAFVKRSRREFTTKKFSS